jgi:transposase
MVAESLASGASVSKVAQRYGVNANLLFTWRRQSSAGVLQTTAQAVELLPVKVADEPTLTSRRTMATPAGRMEIALVGGERIVVGADVDAGALARVVNALSRR